MNVSLSIDEKPGALHVFAALDIIVLLMVLAFVATHLSHRAGVSITLPRSSVRFASDSEALVLTVKGAADPVYYIGAFRVEKGELVENLRRRRDEEGLRTVLLRADARLPHSALLSLSSLVLAEGLECDFLAEPSAGAPGR